MDQEVMDFFDFSKECKRVVAPTGHISSDVNQMITETFESKPPKREVVGVEYVAEIVAKEKQRLDGVRNSLEKIAESIIFVSINKNMLFDA